MFSQKKKQFSLNENLVSLNENLVFKLFNRLTFDVYFDMRMAFGHTMLDWKDTNKNFGLSVVNHRCVLNLENTTFGFRRSFLFLAKAITSYRRSNILFVSGLPAHDNFSEFLKFHQNNLPLLGHGYMLSWVAGLLTNLGTLIETFWGKAKTVVSRYKKQTKRDWFLESAKGMRIFQRFPDFVIFFSISGIYEIAIKEASLLKIPTIAFVDSNCEVNNIPFSITGNDDSAFGLELKIFLFRELILRAMKKRLFTEIDKLLLEGKSLQQLMVDSFMTEFLKEISENQKFKFDLNQKNLKLPSIKFKFLSQKRVKNFIHFFMLYYFNFRIQNHFYDLYFVLYFSPKKKINLLKKNDLKFNLFFFSPKTKKKLNLTAFVFRFVKKKTLNISDVSKFKFLYKILWLCFVNALTFSKKKLFLFTKCFIFTCFADKAVASCFFGILNLRFNSIFVFFLSFNRNLFTFLFSKSKLKFKVLLPKLKKKTFLILTKWKKKPVLFSSNNNFFGISRDGDVSLKFLKISNQIKKTFFLKKVFLWKTKKLHTKSRVKLFKMVNKTKYDFFMFFKYSQILYFFPFLKSFFYKKFKRNKFSRFPSNASFVYSFFLSKKLFFCRKWFFKSPPFLFKRYSKFFKIKKGIYAKFPKIFPNLYNRKNFKVVLHKTKNAYRCCFLKFENHKKKYQKSFVKKFFILQKSLFVHNLKIFYVWKLCFFLNKIFCKNKNLSFLISNILLQYLKTSYIKFVVSKYFSLKNKIKSSIKLLFKKMMFLPILQLVFFELYFFFKLGVSSKLELNNFVLSRFVCFLTNFSNFNLQKTYLYKILYVNLKLFNKSTIRPTKTSSKFFINRFFIFSLFKKVKKQKKIIFAKTFCKLKNSVPLFENFLFQVFSSFKKVVATKQQFSLSFLNMLFFNFFKTKFFAIKKIIKMQKYTNLSSFSSYILPAHVLIKNKRKIFLYSNYKFKKARKVYFSNFSENIKLLNFKISKKQVNFLKIFVPLN